MGNNSANTGRIAKNTILLYIRMFFLMAVSLYTSRVILRTLGVNDFGLYNAVAGFVSMFAFIGNSLTSATQRYMSFSLGKDDPKGLANIFATSINIYAILSIAVAIFAETVGLWFLYNKMTIPADRFGAALWVYHLAIVSTMVMMLSIPYNAVLISREKMGAFAYISILEAVLKLAIVFVLQILGTDKLKLYAVLMLAVQICIRMIYRRYCRKHFDEARYRPVLDKPLLREMCGFAGWNLIGQLANVGCTQGVNVLLNMFFGPAVNAARGVAVQVQNTIRNFCLNFQAAVNPQITKSYSSGDYSYMHQLISASSRFSFFLLFLISLPVMFETEQLLTWWLGEFPEHTVSFIRIILVVSIIEGMANPLVQAALSYGKIRTYQIVVGLSLLATLPAGYFALKAGASPETVFYVLLVITVITFFIRLVIVKPMVNLSIRKFFSEVIIPVTVTTCVSIVPPALAYTYMGGHPVWRFFVVGTLCAVSVCGFSFLICTSRGEKAFIISRIQKFAGKALKKI